MTPPTSLQMPPVATAKQPQFLSTPPQQPQFLAPRPPSATRQQRMTSGSSNPEFVRYVESLAQQSQPQIPQPQPTIGYLMQQRQQAALQQQQPPPVQTLGNFSAQPQAGLVQPEDQIALTNGNYSPVGDDRDILLEDIPQNMVSRLTESPGGSSFSDDTERMYWERYMDPNHL